MARLRDASETSLPKCPSGSPPVVRLALRREKCPRTLPPKVASPDAIVGHLKKEYGCEAQEWVVAVGMDTSGRVLGLLEVSMGGLATAAVDPRVLFAGLLLMGASSFVLAHNHPSGSNEPSQADEQLTRQLKLGAETLGIRLLDHLIITGHHPFYSFTANGRLGDVEWPR